MDIYLKKAVMHIIDRETGTPVFSEHELDLTTEYIRIYLTNKINKLSTAQTKTGVLVQESEFVEKMSGIASDFIPKSQQLVQYWYDIYSGSEDGPSADLLVVLYEEDTILHLALLKLNYKENYTHFVDYENEAVYNKLIINRAILPSKTQKPDEGLVVNLDALSYELLEKRYEFSGEKLWYFSEKVIQSQPAPSLEENVREIKKAVKRIGKKFDEDEFELIASVKEAVYESIEETGTIDNQQIAEQVFKENISARMAYQEEVNESKFVDKTPPVREAREISEKKFGKQKLKMDNGIELIVPLEVYRNSDFIEFENNPDGTVSITLKNIEKISNQL
ncbi:nucleoid-associated protein [Enterococcus sp. BWR-S5]|uniref:nucleoid-associated protein n=1 Tax=Enterococcus sp. BWR-S5 TaxID=2787714 RepID=UPI0019236BC0|nr:nucleoid-associated protein [Enterococcus sp. BWR-S5]MBL1227402.1 nucleoid-associated protein [Enterococcus sp. BWR-S5]